MPYYRRGDDIPLLGRIAGLAQTVEVFASRFGVGTALRGGTGAERHLVRSGAGAGPRGHSRGTHTFWCTLVATDQLEFMSPTSSQRTSVLLADETRLDQVAEAFARVIDAKSPYTALHSEGVASVAVAIGRGMGYSREELITLRRAGLLHDIGKLGVCNQILDKPGRLTRRRWWRCSSIPDIRWRSWCGCGALRSLRRWRRRIMRRWTAAAITWGCWGLQLVAAGADPGGGGHLRGAECRTAVSEGAAAGRGAAASCRSRSAPGSARSRSRCWRACRGWGWWGRRSRRAGLRAGQTRRSDLRLTLRRGVRCLKSDRRPAADAVPALTALNTEHHAMLDNRPVAPR